MRDRAATDAARALILECGWNSTCYQILNEGIEHWWSVDRQALVGYVVAGKMAIVAGAPVCCLEDLPRAIREWEAYAAGRGWEICYFGAEARLQDHLRMSPDYTQVVLGSQPEWRPTEFVKRIVGNASLRAQLNRSRNKAVRVSEWTRERAENNPRLAAVLSEWLAYRGLPTLHFLVEPETLGDLRDRRIFVAEKEGKVLGFVTLCPVPAREGWLTEQFVRSRRAPNGTVELMLYEAASAVEAANSKFLTMGIVPLVRIGIEGDFEEPAWLRLIRRWAQAHYIRFYNFRGLSEFKAKFLPEVWAPVVVIVKARRFGLGHLRAIGRAFAQTSPEIAFIKGVLKAIRFELRGVMGSADKKGTLGT